MLSETSQLCVSITRECEFELSFVTGLGVEPACDCTAAPMRNQQGQLYSTSSPSSGILSNVPQWRRFRLSFLVTQSQVKPESARPAGRHSLGAKPNYCYCFYGLPMRRARNKRRRPMRRARTRVEVEAERTRPAGQHTNRPSDTQHNCSKLFLTRFHL